MKALLKQPINKGLHVTIIHSAESLPSELHPEARLVLLSSIDLTSHNINDPSDVMELAKSKKGRLFREFFRVGRLASVTKTFTH